MTPMNNIAAQSANSPRLALLMATGFGVGYLPKAPGTWGSLLLILLVWLAVSFDFAARLFVPHAETAPGFLFFSVIAVAAVGVWSSGKVARAASHRDPQHVVIDEVSGQQISLLPIGLFHWHPYITIGVDSVEGFARYLLAGFLLFRVFDIWKPWPARAAEKLPGGWGIMADDWVAGIYAAICLWALRIAGI